MNSLFETIKLRRGKTSTPFVSESQDVVVVSTRFAFGQSGTSRGLSKDSLELLSEAVRLVKFGGLLFAYGTPEELAFWGERLCELHDNTQRMLFKYWIALDIQDTPQSKFLKPTHVGLLLFQKVQPHLKSPPPFRVNTDAVRLPHKHCMACGQHLKDWGGKKHLMNPNGAALSDVWRDLPRRRLRSSEIPSDVLGRIAHLTRIEGGKHLHIIQAKSRSVNNGSNQTRRAQQPSSSFKKLDRIEPDGVYQGDCISFLHRVAELHPEGLFDMAFADPPYNLKKSYDSYADELAEREYIEWCNGWLEGMARTLKPGGSLFVLNLPKWAIHHTAFLNQMLEFQHWIVWDALSDPRGKLMPAHYALLYYTKPGGTPVLNYSKPGQKPDSEVVQPPDSPQYCLRASCLKQRKRRGDDAKVELTDIWTDIHRIKHKRDRDAHPCQLPEKLMERIIRLTTNRGGLVFDPFCGAGTTAIAATKLGRGFVVTDVDANYVSITRKKLEAMKENVDLFGNYFVPRLSVQRQKSPASKREVELFIQSLAQQLGRKPTESDIESSDPSILQKIDLIYPTRSAAIKRAKIALNA